MFGKAKEKKRRTSDAWGFAPNSRKTFLPLTALDRGGRNL